MSDVSVAGASVGVGERVGRYFSVVGMLPSLLFVLYAWGLVSCLQGSTGFEPALLLHAIADVSLGQVSALVLLALTLGLALHPFQFAFTQFLEGYWGPQGFWSSMAAARVAMHRDRRDHLERRERRADRQLLDLAILHTTPGDLRPDDPEEDRRAAVRLYLDSPAGAEAMRHYLAREAAATASSSYPRAPRRTMPTRLGNVLRRYEDDLGKQYGLVGLQVAAHLSMSAPPEHSAYLDDARTQMDVAVRLCGLFLLATPITAVLLASSGGWVLFSLFPYFVAYVSYRGAVSSAHSYGNALTTVLDLDRFRLYTALHLPLPETTAEERLQNVQVLELLSGSQRVDVLYEHPERGAEPSGAVSEGNAQPPQ